MDGNKYGTIKKYSSGWDYGGFGGGSKASYDGKLQDENNKERVMANNITLDQLQEWLKNNFEAIDKNLDEVKSEFKTMETRMESKFNQIDNRFDAINGELSAMPSKIVNSAEFKIAITESVDSSIEKHKLIGEDRAPYLITQAIKQSNIPDEDRAKVLISDALKQNNIPNEDKVKTIVNDGRSKFFDSNFRVFAMFGALVATIFGSVFAATSSFSAGMNSQISDLRKEMAEIRKDYTDMKVDVAKIQKTIEIKK